MALPERPVEVTVRYVTRRGQWFGISWKGDRARSGSIIFNIGIHLLDGLIWAMGSAPEVIRAYADPAGDQAEGRFQFGGSPSTRICPPGKPICHRAARRSGPVHRGGGDIICDFSDYSRLHNVVYQEIIAGRGYRIEDAASAVKLAEQVCQMAEVELPTAH